MSDPTANATPTAPPTAPVDDVEVDYFDFHITEDVYLPGSKAQFVTIQAMNEGGKKKYQNMTNRDVTVERGTGNAKMRMAAGDERHTLLTESIIGWHLLRTKDGGDPRNPADKVSVAFSKKELDLFLREANPVVIEHIEKAVRKKNPWLLADMSLEDMIKERDNLDEMIEVKRKEEEGNGGSTSS